MKIKCLTCGKKFHKKGIAMHARSHQPRVSQNEASQLVISDYERGRTQGFREGQREAEDRLQNKRVFGESLRAMADALSAMSHFVAEFPNAR